MIKSKRNFFIGALVCLFLFSVPDVQAGLPTQQLRSDVDRIIEIFKEKTIDKEARDQQILGLIRQRFDFQVMSQWILGVNWKKATNEQRTRFVDLFTQLLENKYKGRIEAYTGEYAEENVKYVQEQIKGKRALVKTFIVTESAEIPVDYKLIQKRSEWRVYDVVIEEVSLVRVYRTTYREIVKKEGFDGLFALMEEKIQDLKSPA